MIEVEIAFALLGIGLAGLCPLVMMQLRQVRKLELTFQGQVSKGPTEPPIQMLPNPEHNLPLRTYLIVPWVDQWARKLTTRGRVLEYIDPATPPPSFDLATSTNRHVSLVSPPVIGDDHTITVTVEVN
jgi:hypothetical protein